MTFRIPTPAGDRMVALVGGLGVFIAFGRPLALVPALPGDLVGAIVGAATFIAFGTIALGLPHLDDSPWRPGLVGTSPLARWALFAAGVMAVVNAITTIFLWREGESVFTPQMRGFVLVATIAASLQVLALVVGAAATTLSAGAARGTRFGLIALAVLPVFDQLMDWVVLRLPSDVLRDAGDLLLWMSKIAVGIGIAAAIAIAWPWLAPHVDRALRVGARVRRHWIDSTP